MRLAENDDSGREEATVDEAFIAWSVGNSEDWRPVVGFPNYACSDQGRVRRAIAVGHGTRAGHVLRPGRVRHGYLAVVLCHGGVTKNELVHRLVLSAFVGPPPAPDAQCNHRNGLKFDNRLTNLEWTTPGENTRHAYATGLATPKRGELHGNAKLSEADVREIRAMRGRETGVSLAQRFGVTQSIVSAIQLRKTWKHI